MSFTLPEAVALLFAHMQLPVVFRFMLLPWHLKPFGSLTLLPTVNLYDPARFLCTDSVQREV